ncbi:MAG: glycosyltransferase [Propionibacteriaceae bacterium]|nr:glycosyltransferase [Propionibacteriaceae bacterium]
MRIALIGNAASIHTVKWANGLASRGHDVHLISQDEPAEHRINDTVTQHRLPHRGTLGYFRNAGPLRRLLATIRPDVANAHYATGYGTTLALARPRIPTVLNVWGSDVNEAPRRSFLHRLWVQANLRRPTRVASTSRSMADGMAWLLRGRRPDITPFGIDVDHFSPAESRPSGVVGTVKGLQHDYGIDTLIRAFALLPDTTRCVIAGQGQERANLERLAAELGVADRVEFTGQIPNTEVPDLLRSFDVYVALSRNESFGVAILEAAACGLPTVVSDAPGPAEVVVAGTTGFVVGRDDPQAAAEAIGKLLADPSLAHRMGEAGRAHTVANYSWTRCLEIMEDVYARAIAGERN